MGGGWKTKVGEGPELMSRARQEEPLMCRPEDGPMSVPAAPAGPVSPANPAAAMSAFGHYTDPPAARTHSEHPPITLGKPPAPKPPSTKKPHASPSRPKQPAAPETVADKIAAGQAEVNAEVDAAAAKPLPPMSPEEEDRYFMPPDVYQRTRGKSPEERAAVLREFEERQLMGDTHADATKGMTAEQRTKYLQDLEAKQRGQ